MRRSSWSPAFPIDPRAQAESLRLQQLIVCGIIAGGTDLLLVELEPDARFGVPGEHAVVPAYGDFLGRDEGPTGLVEGFEGDVAHREIAVEHVDAGPMTAKDVGRGNDDVG